MLSVQKHGVCWGFSVATALVFAIIPASHYIFPTCFALLLIKRYKRYKKRDSDIEEHARLGPISEYFQTERDASPLTIGLYLLSLGALARMLCVYGPQGVVRWRQIIVFQTLLVFTFIGHEPDFARNDALDVPFPRIPTRNPLTYPFRRFYADTIFWAIVCFEIVIFDFILRLFCGAPGGMKDVFYPLNREVNIGHHIGYFCMLCPLFDSAETLFYYLNRRLFPSLIPTPDAPELDRELGKRWTTKDTVQYASVTVSALVWCQIIRYVQSREPVEVLGVRVDVAELWSSCTALF